MELTLQRKLYEEIVDYLNRNGTSLAATAQPHSGATYFDPAYMAREKALMATLPVIVGHGSSIPEPYQYIAHDDTGVPVIVVRQPDGRLKAFLNICRHRAARLCPSGQGQAKLFACPYHGWTYRSDGRLHALLKEGFPEIDDAQSHLVELPVEERHGLIWLITTPGLDIDVAAFLGDLDVELASFPMRDFQLERAEVLEYDINWKFVLDGFLEVYHIPKLHSNTIAPYFFGRHSPFQPMGRHGRLLGVRKIFDDIKDEPFDSDRFLRSVAINYQVFPNSFFIWQGDHFEIWTPYPTDVPGRCKVRIQSLCTPDMIGGEWTRRWDRNWKILIDTVKAEDWAMSQEVQADLPHLPDHQVLFGRNEPALQHFHTELDRALAPA